MTKTQIENNQWEHRYGGNGFAVIDLQPNDYCRVVGVGKDKLETQAFLAWTKLLTIEKHALDWKVPNSPLVPKLLSDEAKVQLTKLREDLASGRLVVKSSHIQRPK